MNIKLKDLLAENTIKIKADTSSYQNLPSRNLHNKESIDTISKILEKYGFKYKGKTGGYPTDHWVYTGKKYNVGYYRLTGDVQRDYIEMEEINIGHWER